ncbi:MAG: hypothetical protein H8E24_07050 [Verrucomicrobia bacterium]|nr:hypothetical protein [Verrucomicrobiota bacterium]
MIILDGWNGAYLSRSRGSRLSTRCWTGTLIATQLGGEFAKLSVRGRCSRSWNDSHSPFGRASGLGGLVLSNASGNREADGSQSTCQPEFLLQHPCHSFDFRAAGPRASVFEGPRRRQSEAPALI